MFTTYIRGGPFDFWKGGGGVEDFEKKLTAIQGERKKNHAA
jgi:hypothetical protein